jgi:DNA-binding MarR family transcriptional regulator
MTAPTLGGVTATDRQSSLARVEDDMVRIMRSVRATVVRNATAFCPEVQPSGYSIMTYIAGHHPTPPSAIVAHTGMDKSAVSRQLRILKDLDFVTCTPDPSDKRADLYAPTPEALERLERLRAEARAAYAEIFDEWADADLSRFAELLTAFTERVEDVR